MKIAPRLRLTLALALTASPCAWPPLALAAETLQPFEVSYTVTWRGMSAGTSTVTLKRLDGERWSYESRNNARGIFKVALPSEINQGSELRIEDGTVTPLRFHATEGGKRTSRSIELEFDWDAARVSGIAEGKSVDFSVEPGTQDPMSVQIALISALTAGRVPESFRMVDKDQVKDYLYTREGVETLQTPLGSIETEIYRSRRPQAERGTLFWCAPSLGYVPVKVERRNGSRVEWSMVLTSLKRE